jgi:hypothetical protein
MGMNLKRNIASAFRFLCRVELAMTRFFFWCVSSQDEESTVVSLHHPKTKCEIITLTVLIIF